jgi:hypothetical protein
MNAAAPQGHSPQYRAYRFAKNDRRALATDSKFIPGKHRDDRVDAQQGLDDIQMADNGEARFRITSAGEAALKAKIPMDR